MLTGASNVLLASGALNPSSAEDTFRIVSLNPTLTELLFSIGLGKSIVGTSSHSNFPKEAKKIPVIGQYLHPQSEKILRLKPTHILSFREGDPSIQKQVHTNNIQFIVLDGQTLNDFENTIKKLGEVFQAKEASHKILEKWSSDWKLVSAFRKDPSLKSSHLQKLDSPSSLKQAQSHNDPKEASSHLEKTLFIQMGFDPIFTAGKNTFLSEGFSKCHLTNIFNDLRDYKMVPLESVIKKKPQVILSMGPANNDSPFKKAKEFWGNNPITKDALLIRGNADNLARLSPRLPLSIYEICKEAYR